MVAKGDACVLFHGGASEAIVQSTPIPSPVVHSHLPLNWADELDLEAQARGGLAPDEAPDVEGVGGGTAETSKWGSAVPESRGGTGAEETVQRHLLSPGPNLMPSTTLPSEANHMEDDGKGPLVPLVLWRSACMQILIRLRADTPFDPFARSCVGIRDGCLRLFGQAPIHICGAGRLPLQFLLVVQLARERWGSDAANGHNDQVHCLAARPETVAELSDPFSFGAFDADTNPSSAKARPPRRDIRSGAQRRKRR